MCGFAAVIGDKPLNDAELHKIASQLDHRGPTASGTHSFQYGDKFVSLAFKRLSILDVGPASDQPFFSSCGKYILLFNGEIYNYVELKNNLVSAGFDFRTKSDTEVLLNSYIYYGNDMFSYLEGMFSFVLFDLNLGHSLVARDPFGEKPLYVKDTSGLTIISSEQKAILAHPDVEVLPNISNLFSKCFEQRHFSSESIFEGINVFPSAHFSSSKITDFCIALCVMFGVFYELASQILI